MKSAGQWVQMLERVHACDKHVGKSCIVKASGDHYELTKPDLSLWGMMMVRNAFVIRFLVADRSQTKGHDSDDKPPRQLKIEDAKSAPRSEKKSEDPHPIQVGGYPPLTPGPYPFYPYGYPPAPPGYGMDQYHSGRFKIASSDPIEEAEDPTLFPKLEGWLRELDQGKRGADNRCFLQYAIPLEANGFSRIFQLADKDMISSTDLISMCPGMNQGTASLLLGYAREDTEKIRKREARRARMERFEPQRFM